MAHMGCLNISSYGMLEWINLIRRIERLNGWKAINTRIKAREVVTEKISVHLSIITAYLECHDAYRHQNQRTKSRSKLRKIHA